MLAKTFSVETYDTGDSYLGRRILSFLGSLDQVEQKYVFTGPEVSDVLSS